MLVRVLQRNAKSKDQMSSIFDVTSGVFSIFLQKKGYSQKTITLPQSSGLFFGEIWRYLLICLPKISLKFAKWEEKSGTKCNLAQDFATISR